MQNSAAGTQRSLADLLGTYLQVSARFAPPSYSLRTVSGAFDEWSQQQSMNRLMRNFDHVSADDFLAADGEPISSAQ